MFNLQQKYKNISQDAKPGNEFIGDTTDLPRTDRSGNHKEQKGNLGRPHRKKKMNSAWAGRPAPGACNPHPSVHVASVLHLV